jgi:hypothetical protein
MTAEFQPKAAGMPSFPADYWQTYPFFGPSNGDLKDAWAICEALVLAMRDETSRHHAEFWLMMLDMPAQVEPDLQRRIKFQERLGVDTLFRSDQLLSDFAAQAEIRHVALAPELARYAAERKVVLHGFKGTPRNTGHLNEEGHLAVGQLIARVLRENSSRLSREPLESR